jgi:uncharacterized protein YebE (UPF0316 family)
MMELERVVLQALLIFVLRVVGISIGTLRTILIVRGRRLPAILAGSLNTLLHVVAIGQVVGNLGNVWIIAAYTIGFGVGTWVGMILEGRIALGHATVQTISIERSEAVAAALRGEGYGVTRFFGQGREYAVGIVEAIVPRKRVPDVIELAERIDDRAIVTVCEAKTVHRGYWDPDGER